MRTVRFAILFSMLALLCFGGTALAQESARTGCIEGTVRLKEGSNAGVEVTAIETATGQPYFTKTDEKGRFRFSELPPGEFQVFTATERFYPVWETGMVNIETPWQPELLIERRMRLKTPNGLTHIIFYAALERFRESAAVCLGTITSISLIPGTSDSTGQKYLLGVVVQENLKGEVATRWVTVEATFNQPFAETVQPGREILVCFTKAGPATELSIRRFFLVPESPSKIWALDRRLWQLVSMVRLNRATRPELVEWLITGIVEKETREQTTWEALNILKRGRAETKSEIEEIGNPDPFDLAVDGQPLFSEAQTKRIADVIFQDDSMLRTDLEVIRLLIDLKYPQAEELLLAQIEKRKNDWTGLTGNLLLLHSSLRKEKEPERLAKLFENVQSAASLRVALENPNQTQMTQDERISKVRALAEPQLLAILKSYLWTIEHPAKDAQ
jgi:hypothetical protein